jgi:hypothetical protein
VRRHRGHTAMLMANMERNDTMNSLILNLSRNSALRSNLDYHLIRAAMIFTFYIFSYQKWFSFEAQQSPRSSLTAHWSSG